MVMKSLANQKNPQSIIDGGSDSFTYKVPSIATGKTVWLDVESIMPKSRQFLPLDLLDIVNNTMCLLTVYFNSPSETYIVPASMIKTINKPYRRIGIKNEDIAVAAANIALHMKRLPKENIVKVVQGQ